MMFAYCMLIAAAMMPYLTIVLAKSAGVDNRAPRPSNAAMSSPRSQSDRNLFTRR